MFCVHCDFRVEGKFCFRRAICEPHQYGMMCMRYTSHRFTHLFLFFSLSLCVSVADDGKIVVLDTDFTVMCLENLGFERRLKFNWVHLT